MRRIHLRHSLINVLDYMWIWTHTIICYLMGKCSLFIPCCSYEKLCNNNEEYINDLARQIIGIFIYITKNSFHVASTFSIDDLIYSGFFKMIWINWQVQYSNQNVIKLNTAAVWKVRQYQWKIDNLRPSTANIQNFYTHYMQIFRIFIHII